MDRIRKEVPELERKLQEWADKHEEPIREKIEQLKDWYLTK